AGAFATAEVGGTPGTANPGGEQVTFLVDGATATIVDPGAGGSVDVNVVNDRNWIDVDFVAPAGFGIDSASILDLAPEFTLAGAGIGTVVLDATRAPVELDAPAPSTKRFRNWVTGAYAGPGTVTLTYLAGSWSHTVDANDGLVVDGVTLGEIALIVSFPTITAGWVVDEASILNAATTPIALVDFLDPATGDAVTTWHLVSIGTPEQVGVNRFRYVLQVTLDTGAPTTVVVQYEFVSGTWLERQGAATQTATFTGPDVNDPELDPALRQTVAVAVSGPGTITVTLPDSTPATGGLALDPASVLDAAPEFVDADGDAGNGIQLHVTSGTGWVVTLDQTRAVVRVGATSQYIVPVVLALDSGASMTAVVTPQLLAGSVAFAGALPGGTQGGSSRPLTGDELRNDRTFVDVAFAGAAGTELDLDSIGDGIVEFTLGGFGGTGIGFAGGPQGLHLGGGVFRFMLDGDLRPGEVVVSFNANSWDDNGARGPPVGTNRAFTQTFSVVGATADLVRTIPAAGDQPERVVALGGGSIGLDVINGLGYLEVTFRPSSGYTLDHTTINGDELELRDAAGALVPLASTPIRVGLGDTYRYAFAAPLAAGKYTLSFVAGSFADSHGVANEAETEELTVEVPGAGLGGPVVDGVAGPTQGAIVDRDSFDGAALVLDVTFRPTTGALVEEGTIDGDELTLSGAGTESLTITSITKIGDRTWRYVFDGLLGTGKVTVAFAQGGWEDTAGNAGGAGTAQFAVITQAQSFFIELSGGVILQAAGLTSEPLLEAKAEVVLEIDSARGVFVLTFVGQLKLIGLGTVGATAGRFVLDTSDGLGVVPQFWGVATLETNFAELEQYGLYLSGKGTLQVNTTDTEKVETITLPGLGPNGEDVTRTYTLRPTSFALELVGIARVRPPGSTTDLVRLEGGFYLSIDPAQLQLYATASLSFGVGDAQLTYGEATGLLVVTTGLDGRNPGVAGLLTVGSSAGVGLPNLGTLFSVSGSVSVMFNTTLQDQVFQVPDAFLPLLDPGDPTTITIYGAAPGLDGGRNPNAPPGGEVYVRASILAEITIGPITLTGFIQVTAAVGSGGARLEVTGAVGTQIAYLGSLTGLLNLSVTVGPNPGVVGRVYLALSSAGSIPGVSLSGVFLLEVNTFSTQQTIQTFKLKEKQFEGMTLFDGFERDGAGKLVVANQQITITGGFRLVLAGHLVVGPLDIAAEARFTLQLSGASPTIELLLNGSVSISPLGSVKLLNSGFRITSEGLVARGQVELDAAFGSSVGLSVTASALLALNTTGRVQSFGGATVDPGFRLRIDGQLALTGFEYAQISGYLD
ncbi:MAG TPA: hypothetical protein VF044_00950, partial [Actinomycetota bacterium]